jgi:hypothetical protein
VGKSDECQAATRHPAHAPTGETVGTDCEMALLVTVPTPRVVAVVTCRDFGGLAPLRLAGFEVSEIDLDAYFFDVNCAACRFISSSFGANPLPSQSERKKRILGLQRPQEKNV